MEPCSCMRCLTTVEYSVFFGASRFGLQTIEWVHQCIAGDGGRGTAGSCCMSMSATIRGANVKTMRTCSERVVLVAFALVSAEGVFCGLVGCEVYSVRRSWSRG